MAYEPKKEGVQSANSTEPASDAFGGTPQVSALITLLAEELDRTPQPDRTMVLSANTGTLTIRPVFHQLETRVEAHVFIAFTAAPAPPAPL
jgi:hypothetical protein